MTAQPSGAATPRDSDAHERIAVPKAFCVLRERPPAKTQKRPSSPFYTLATQSFRNVRNAPRVVIPPPSEMPPVSACEPLCAIFLREPGVYPFLPMKENVSRLWEKLKDAMKSGWGIKFIAAALPDFSRLLVLWVHKEPGNVCI